MKDVIKRTVLAIIFIVLTVWCIAAFMLALDDQAQRALDESQRSWEQFQKTL